MSKIQAGDILFDEGGDQLLLVGNYDGATVFTRLADGQVSYPFPFSGLLIEDELPEGVVKVSIRVDWQDIDRLVEDEDGAPYPEAMQPKNGGILVTLRAAGVDRALDLIQNEFPQDLDELLS